MHCLGLTIFVKNYICQIYPFIVCVAMGFFHFYGYRLFHCTSGSQCIHSTIGKHSFCFQLFVNNAAINILKHVLGHTLTCISVCS